MTTKLETLNFANRKYCELLAQHIRVNDRAAGMHGKLADLGRLVSDAAAETRRQSGLEFRGVVTPAAVATAQEKETQLRQQYQTAALEIESAGQVGQQMAAEIAAARAEAETARVECFNEIAGAIRAETFDKPVLRAKILEHAALRITAEGIEPEFFGEEVWRKSLLELLPFPGPQALVAAAEGAKQKHGFPTIGKLA